MSYRAIRYLYIINKLLSVYYGMYKYLNYDLIFIIHYNGIFVNMIPVKNDRSA